MACFLFIIFLSPHQRHCCIWYGLGEQQKLLGKMLCTPKRHTCDNFCLSLSSSCLFANTSELNVETFLLSPTHCPSCRLSSLRLCPALVMGKRQKVNIYPMLISENYFPGCSSKDLWIIKLCKCSSTAINLR